MPNILDATGLQVKTRAELIASFTSAFQTIYGADISLASDSPDGQMMNIYVQSVLDVQDLLVAVYNSFNPDAAFGVSLDQRVAMNGLQRQAGTYTVTPITVVTSQAVNLYGLDQTAQDVFTVSDSAGNRWFLIATQLGVAAGSASFQFRAEKPGKQLTTPNTITVPVTILLGVTSVNNPTSYLSLGVNEETDVLLRIRRQRAVSLASQGYLAGLKAALENVNGITSAFVYENTSAATNSDGVPGHSIWAIIAGTAVAADIAQAIYTKRNAGCGMFGSSSYLLTQLDGSPFTIFWDTVIPQNLFIAFTLSSISGTVPPNIAGVRAGLATKLLPGAFETIDINEVATLVQSIEPNALVTAAGLSNGLTQVLTLSAVAASGTFKISCNGSLSAAINWNDNAATIQTKVRAISTDLAAATVTGSIAGLALTIALAVPSSAPALFFVTNNSLLTAGSVAITFTYSQGYATTLVPSSKRNQFVVSAANIVILPMLLTPSSTSIARTTTLQMTGLGGYGSNTYSIQTNNSGGSINATTGLYTAGATPSVTDTVKVVDAFGNSATATIAVT